jgi:hypothetical protein
MSGLRPEVIALFARWNETLAALVFAAFGLWLFSIGGLFFQGLGALVVLAGLAGAILAYRRLRFAREVDQPGIVEIDEAELRYLGPQGGGFASLAEIVEVELLADLSGRLWWRVSEAGGNVLAIPAAAQGADQLFDAFARLPGLSPAALLAALDGPKDRPVTVWRKAPRRALT